MYPHIVPGSDCFSITPSSTCGIDSLTLLCDTFENIWAKPTEILSALKDTLSVRIEILPPKMLESVMLLLPAIFRGQRVFV